MKIGAGVDKSSSASSTISIEEDRDLRRGPWTPEEDLMLKNYISSHGEGRWNSLARSAGLKRTGKSCRLRWLNYLRKDLKRGEFTPEEQLLILELHSRWDNRWSKIAQHMPGRTDNDIKNYWRTRVQKHAKQLKCDVNSQQFKDVMKYLWVPRLLERIRAANPGSMALTGSEPGQMGPRTESTCGPESSTLTQVSSLVRVTADCGDGGENKGGDRIQEGEFSEDWTNWCESLDDPSGYSYQGLLDFEWWQSENLWTMDNLTEKNEIVKKDKKRI